MTELFIDDLPVKLKNWHNLAWLSDFGRVFCVFDQLISGNLCFGVEENNTRLFIKYAGAPTLMYAGQPEAAIQRLLASRSRYEELSHPCVNRYLGEVRTPQGHALVFAWFTGFALAPMEVHLHRLRNLPLLSRLALFDQLMDLLVLASARDYLIAGLAHQHILIDFDKNRAMLSSLSAFARFPASTPYPKLPGSSLFVPPEGYRVGQPLDESSNVYALAALAFTFFDNSIHRLQADWSAGPALYELANANLNKKPGQRLQSTAQFQKLWREIVLNSSFS